MKDRRGDHLLNSGPGSGIDESARARKRFLAKNAGKTDLGRDELFRQRAGMVPKGQRVRIADQTKGQAN